MSETIANTKKVGYYMRSDPICVERTTSIEEILKIFRNQQISHVLVVEDHKLIGLISKEDLLQDLIEFGEETTGQTLNQIHLHLTQAHLIMSEDLITLKENDHRDFAMELLLQGQFHSLPVVDEQGKPIGIITALDLLKGYYETLQKMSAS